jgi:hypothetical protein
MLEASCFCVFGCSKFNHTSTFYDGKQFISRLGNPFTPPQWFLDSSVD